MLNPFRIFCLGIHYCEEPYCRTRIPGLCLAHRFPGDKQEFFRNNQNFIIKRIDILVSSIQVKISVLQKRGYDEA